MSGDAQSLLDKYGITVPPSLGEAGADGGCLYVGRWEDEDYRFIVPFMTVNAPRCSTKELDQKMAQEWNRAITGSERYRYLGRLADYAGRIGATGAVGPIKSDADTPAGVADDMVKWLCDTISLSLDEANIPQDLRDRAKEGPILPPGFTARALRPPDTKGFFEGLDQGLNALDRAEWQIRWGDLISTVLSVAMNGAPLLFKSQSWKKYQEVMAEVHRIRAASATADDPDAYTAEKLRSMAGEQTQTAPVPPVAEDEAVPAEAMIAEHPDPYAWMLEQTEELQRKTEQAEAEAHPDSHDWMLEQTEELQREADQRDIERIKNEPKPPKVPIPLMSPMDEWMRENREEIEKNAEQAQKWINSVIEVMGPLATSGIDFLQGLKDGAIKAELENWEGIAELIQNFFAWRLYKFEELSAFVDLSRFQEGHDAIEGLFAALRDLLADPQELLAELENMLSELEEQAGRVIDDPLGEVQKLVDGFFAELQAAADLWSKEQYYESGMAYGIILSNTFSELAWVFGKVKKVAKMTGNVANAVGKKGKKAKEKKGERSDNSRSTSGPSEQKSTIPSDAKSEDHRPRDKNKGNKSNKTGWDFEDRIHEKLGGRKGFKVQGRQFDGAYGPRDSIWYEAKAGGYWEGQIKGLSPKELEKKLANLKARFGQTKGIAESYGAKFEIISQNEIPRKMKAILDELKITYREGI